MIKFYTRSTDQVQIDQSPLDLIKQGASDNPNWTIDKEVYADIVGNGSNKLSELYLNVDNPVNGEKSYFSFVFTEDGDGRKASRVIMYVNTGFDTNQTVDNQPGRLSGETGTEYFLWNSTGEMGAYNRELNRFGYFDEIVVVDDISISIMIRSLEYAFIHAYFGVYNLHFNMANSGTFVITNTGAYSNYYFRYGNIWYGDGVGNSSADEYQGRFDVDKPPYSYDYAHTPYGNVELYKQTLWINDDNVEVDKSFSCVGYIDRDICYSSDIVPKIFNNQGNKFVIVPFGGYSVVSSKGTYIAL